MLLYYTVILTCDACYQTAFDIILGMTIEDLNLLVLIMIRRDLLEPVKVICLNLI